MKRTAFTMRSIESQIPFSIFMVCEWDHGRCKSGGRVDTAIRSAIIELETEQQQQQDEVTDEIRLTELGREVQEVLL